MLVEFSSQDESSRTILQLDVSSCCRGFRLKTLSGRERYINEMD